MKKNRTAYVVADVSELWAGYLAILIEDDKEEVIPCRTKDDAQEYVDRWLDKAEEVV